MIKTVKEAKKILRKKKKYHAYNGDKKIGTTYAIDSARLLAVNYGDRVIFKRDGEVINEFTHEYFRKPFCCNVILDNSY